MFLRLYSGITVNIDTGEHSPSLSLLTVCRKDSMESLGAFPDGEWEFFSKMFSSEELGEDFTSLFLGHCSNFIEHDDKELELMSPFSFCPTTTDTDVSGSDANESLFYPCNILYSNFQGVCQSNIPNSSQETFFLGDSIASATNDVSMSTNACFQEEENIGSSLLDVLIEETLSFDNEDMSMHIVGSNPAAIAVPVEALPLKRKFDVPQNNNDTHLDMDLQRKPRVSGDVQKNKKNVRSKKNQNNSPNDNKDEVDSNSGTSYNSEDDDASQESNEGTNSKAKESKALNSRGKKGATARGSATDPQSLYARKRRERINERLKILQNLVPNGTKVDISTMLEEAVHYVKFLQLQIKLLSHDDLWMYAPIAYGLDIGLNQKFSSLL